MCLLTNKQLSSVIINAIVVKMIVSLPRNIFVYCGNAAWLAAIYATAIGFGLFSVLKKLYTTKDNVIGLAEKTGGSVLRIVTGLCVFLVLSASLVGIVRIFPDIIRLVLLQKTYLELIGTVFVVSIILGAWCGIEAIARVHQIFLPIAGIVFAAFLVMLFPDFHGQNLFPILGNGIKSITVDGLACLSVFSDLLMLNILIPRMKDVECYRKSGSRAVIIGGACAIFIFLAYGLCYVYPASAEFIIPIYQMERLINLSDFFSRLEAVFQFIWSISILLYSAFYLAVLAEVWCETFALHHSKPLVAPIIIILVGVCIIPESLNEAIYYNSIINKWLYIPAFFIPIIIGGLYKLFHVKQNTVGEINE